MRGSFLHILDEEGEDVRLRVSGIEFYYDSIKALDGITFSANRGEFIGLIGPNGSGKTTLLKVIDKALKPVRGSVYLNFRDISKMGWRELAREIAVVPQNTQIDFDFKVFDVVMMGRHPHLGRFSIESEGDEKKVRYWMKLTNVLHLADRSIKEISGGERQRVLIARALAQEPEVLLLDEPTANLDVNYQLEIMSLLRRLVMENELTIICAIHDLNLAARYSDKLLVMKNGRIVRIGEPWKILTRKLLREVFNIEAKIYRDEESGKPIIIPMHSALQAIERREIMNIEVEKST
ncbi:MAG: ABC transporter ATP-binding protein [Thaumarchaeota archaeon]|nr:ABC transporter ATP-binding protein [Nitrososphaerota archaeon]